MYADIYGKQGGMTMLPEKLSLMCVAQFIMIVCIFIIVIVDTLGGKRTGFANLPNDYGIGQRGDVVVATPQLEELSLRQKQDIAVAKLSAENTSQLTGTRDIPVFFQDYDVEAVRSKNGAVSTAREGFTGKADDDLEKALAGH